MDTNEKQFNVAKYAKRAQELEAEKQFEQSRQLYLKAAQILNMQAKDEENDYNRDIYKKKAEEYVAKIKKLNLEIEKQKKVSFNNQNDGNAKPKETLSGCLVWEKSDVKWANVVGLVKAKEALQEAVVLPIKFPQLFLGIRRPWKGILLYGPSGTGKSYIAKALANEIECNFLTVSLANIGSKWMGESERIITALFDLARKNKPAVIFVDEIDLVANYRGEEDNYAARRLKTEFLIQMQGANDGIIILGATNIPWCLDPSVRRRFERRICIPLPELEARKLMIMLNLGDTQNSLTDEDFLELAKTTDGYSCSDIASLAQEAIYQSLLKCQSAKFFKYLSATELVPCSSSDPGACEMTMDDMPDPSYVKPPPVVFEDFVQSLRKIKSTVNKTDLLKHKQFTQQFSE